MYYLMLGFFVGFLIVTAIDSHGFRKILNLLRNSLSRWYRRHFLPPGYRIRVLKYPSIICPSREYKLVWQPKGSPYAHRELDAVNHKSEIPILRYFAWRHHDLISKSINDL